jgi:ribosome-binding factor A
MLKGELKSPSQRQLRVGEELRHILAELLERGELHDPALAGIPVTVTEVRVSSDLRNATAFVVPLGRGADASVIDALTRARGFVRRRVGGLARLKFVPEFTFRFDTSFDQADRIESLLREPAVARDLEQRDGDKGSAGRGR